MVTGNGIQLIGWFEPVTSFFADMVRECFICLQPLTRPLKRSRDACAVPCKHTDVHITCLMQWYAVSPTCPACKMVNEQYVLNEERKVVRARRRRHMEAGLSFWRQEDEDVCLAVERSMLEGAGDVLSPV